MKHYCNSTRVTRISRIRDRAILPLLTFTVAAGTMYGQAANTQEQPVRTDEFYHTIMPRTAEAVPPFQMFDNLYYIGTNDYAAYLIKTSAGLIMIDSLTIQMADHLIPAIQQLGLNPADVKYLVISHSHPDHWGGAQIIKKATGARILMSEQDWQVLEKLPGTNTPEPPKRDMVVKDGDTLTLGDETLKFWFTPGHTPGTISVEFPVFDGGKQYKAFFQGGYRFGNNAETLNLGMASLQRLLDAGGPKNIDVNLYCHQFSADVLERGEKLKSRKPGDPNPFVVPGEFAVLMQFRIDIAKKSLEALEAKKTQQSQ